MEEYCIGNRENEEVHVRYPKWSDHLNSEYAAYIIHYPLALLTQGVVEKTE
jgi:hypothetical protein